jgi:hypothetical protein
VYLNDAPAAKLAFTTDLGMSAVELPQAALVSGSNRIELRRLDEADSEIALSTFWLDGASTSTYVDVGTDGAKPQLAGNWGTAESLDGRTIQAIRHGSASVRFPSGPLPQDYAVVLVARCLNGGEGAQRLGLTLGGRELGEVSVESDWATLVLRVPVDRLMHGEGMLQLVLKTIASGAILVDRVVIVPLQDRVLINAGGSRARAFLFHPGTERYVIVLCARTLRALAPLALKVRLNGHSIGTLSLSDTLELHELSVPSWNFATGSNRLDFEYETSAQPRKLDPSSTDSRDLAMQLDWLEVRGESRGPSRAKGSAG